MFLKLKDTTTLNSTENKIVDNIRCLSIDMINEAKSGHPGIALGAAPMIYTMYAKHLKINPKDPNWINRDRFILSAGHGSSLLYSTLFMSGFDLSLEDLKDFRKKDSKTPGHPEYKVTPGVDITTGPLGQGFASAVGIAIGETILRKHFQKDNLIDYYTYVLCSDGDLMEGVSYEAASLAGTLKLNKLIVLYDSNKICLTGNTENQFNQNTTDYFTALNWNVIQVNDGEDITAIDNAIIKAKNSTDKPNIIIVNTTIGKHSKWQGTAKVHGTPLLEEDIESIKETLNVRNIPFAVSSEAIEEMQNMIKSRNEPLYEKWINDLENLDEVTKQELNQIMTNDLSIKNTNIDFDITDEETEDLRLSSSKVLNSLSNQNSLFIGGSADLSSSTLTYLENGGDYSSTNHDGKNIFYGVREHAMGAISNGITLAGVRNFSSTYLAFSDYLKPSIRLACQMNLPNIYIFTHDSITVGPDGATHQPVEQLVSLRSTPNLEVYRPSDANEMIATYQMIASKTEGPSAIVISRNKTRIKENTSIKEAKNGGYIIKNENNKLDGIIISSGEEIDIALDVANLLQEKGYDIRVVSMLSIEVFKKQDIKYQETILPPNTKTFVIEASSSYSWHQFVNDKENLFTVDRFGKSASLEDIKEDYNLNPIDISRKLENLLD